MIKGPSHWSISPQFLVLVFKDHFSSRFAACHAICFAVFYFGAITELPDSCLHDIERGGLLR
jgi:hypothetical protein